jgi:hypothetical protein
MLNKLQSETIASNPIFCSWIHTVKQGWPSQLCSLQIIKQHMKIACDNQKLFTITITILTCFQPFSFVTKWYKIQRWESSNLESRDSCLSTAITDNSIKIQCIEMPHLLLFLSMLPKSIQRWYIRLHGIQLFCMVYNFPPSKQDWNHRCQYQWNHDTCRYSNIFFSFFVFFIYQSINVTPFKFSFFPCFINVGS